MKVIHKNGLSITYTILRKPIKNTYFRIKDGICVVSAHPRTSLLTIESFIDLKFDIFYKKILESTQMEPDNNIVLWGKTYEIIKTYGNFSYEISSDVIYLRSKSNDQTYDKKRIYAYELKKMVDKLSSKVKEVIGTVGLSLLPTKIKYLRSKFGSYHKKNHEITLNSFLARLNPIYLEYVIYHEYAHVLIFNHSKDFYNLLDKLMPYHRLYQKDLKKIAIT